MPPPLAPSDAPRLARERVVDLAARRAAAHEAVRAAAAAPVRHITADLLLALQGSWGTPDEVLGRRTPRPVLALAR